ncbi:uncharacterized protein LOC144445070 [Glandiceps talaboti]
MAGQQRVNNMFFSIDTLTQNVPGIQNELRNVIESEDVKFNIIYEDDEDLTIQYDDTRQIGQRCDEGPFSVLALCSANYKFSHMNEDERSLVMDIEHYLKQEGPFRAGLENVLLWHILAGVFHEPQLRGVDIWTNAPSSSPRMNNILQSIIRNICRALRTPLTEEQPPSEEQPPPEEPLFIRHKRVTKSRYMDRDRREDRHMLCTNHLNSIHVNPIYRDALQNRVVCIIDDYITHGNTFESLRVLLTKCNVKRVIHFAIGKFWTWEESGGQQYKALSCEIVQGDVYMPENRQYQFGNDNRVNCVFKDEARDELSQLARIIENI